MNTRSQLIGAWCGPAFMAALATGFILLSNLFPPHSPTFTGPEVAAFYQADPGRIRLGLLVFLWATALYLPFAGVLTVQMARIEGRFPMWTCVQAMASAGNVLTLTFPMAFWSTAAFRPERSAELIQLLDDLAWVPFVGMTSPFLVIPICIAIVGFMDKSAHPIFPRWACFYNIFAVSLLLPGGLIIFFKTGPFAWNGLFGIWIPFIDWGIWFCVMTYLLIKGVKQQALLEQEAGTSPAGSTASNSRSQTHAAARMP